MRIPFIYSAAAATLFTVIGIDILVQHLAIASHESTDNSMLAAKQEPSPQPVVIARFAKNDAAFTPQALEQTLHCVSDAFSSTSDLCGPMPVLTSKAATSLPMWQMTKMPIKFIWQQQVLSGRKLVVELSDNSGPLKSRAENFRNGDKESIIISPSSEVNSGEVFLVANLYGTDGKRLENWVLPVSIKK